MRRPRPACDCVLLHMARAHMGIHHIFWCFFFSLSVVTEEKCTCDAFIVCADDVGVCLFVYMCVCVGPLCVCVCVYYLYFEVLYLCVKNGTFVCVCLCICMGFRGVVVHWCVYTQQLCDDASPSRLALRNFCVL